MWFCVALSRIYSLLYLDFLLSLAVGSLGIYDLTFFNLGDPIVVELLQRCLRRLIRILIYYEGLNQEDDTYEVSIVVAASLDRFLAHALRHSSHEDPELQATPNTVCRQPSTALKGPL